MRQYPRINPIPSIPKDTYYAPCPECKTRYINTTMVPAVDGPHIGKNVCRTCFLYYTGGRWVTNNDEL